MGFYLVPSSVMTWANLAILVDRNTYLNTIIKKAENTFISSTFWGERVGYTAAIATIKEFKK